MASARVGHRVSLIIENSMVCYRPNSTTTNGILYLPSTQSILEYSFPLLMLQVSLIFAVSRTLHFLLRPLRQPMVISQILAGIILGPSGLGRKGNVVRIMFLERSITPLSHFATMGIMFYLFVLGVKMDLSMIWRSGRKSIAIGVLALLFPFALSNGVSHLFKAFHVDNYLLKGLHFGALALSKTTFPVVATLLTELKMLNSELGRLALSSSMVSESCNIILSVAIATKRLSSFSHHKIRTASMFIGSFISFLCFIGVVVPPVAGWMIKQIQVGKPLKEIYILSILVAVLVSAFTSHALGLHVLIGPLVMGFAIPDGPPLGSALVNRLETFTTDFMLPLYLTVSCLRTDLHAILDRQSLLIMVVMILMSFLGKIAGIMLPCWFSKVPVRDALTLTFIMCAKGVIELSTFTLWLHSRTMNTKIFSIMVVIVIVVASIVTPLVELLYDPSRKYVGYNNRTIQHSKRDAGLRILACIHEQDNIPTIIKLLEASNPTRDSPLYVCVLHLVELVGRAAPILISHQGQRSNFSTSSGSEHIINAFQNYEQQNKGMITVKAFTAISPANTMHDDICTLALNKWTSLIILPFHKICFDYGTMSSGKANLRNLNCSVLDRAPCSVGILVDRGHLNASSPRSSMTSSFRIAVLFLGGADDREALSYAKRMIEQTSMRITVVRLIAPIDNDVMEWENMLDAEAIKEFKLTTVNNERVIFVEEVVSDGGQTAWIIHSMENEFDLIMVGRRHGLDSPLTSGLMEWSECPELGSIGDMLASSDIKGGVSVLVVQQKKK